MSSERAEVVVFQYPAQIVTQTLVSHQVEPYICHSLSKWLTRWLPVGYLRLKLCILRRFLPEKRQITTNQRGVWMFVPKLFYVMCIKTTSLIWSDNNPHHGPCPRVLFCALIGHFDCPPLLVHLFIPSWHFLPCFIKSCNFFKDFGVEHIISDTQLPKK